MGNPKQRNCEVYENEKMYPLRKRNERGLCSKGRGCGIWDHPEDCAVKVEGAGYGIILSSDEAKLFGGRIGKPKVAICPKCGEVSIYLEDVSKLN